MGTRANDAYRGVRFTNIISSIRRKFNRSHDRECGLQRVKLYDSATQTNSTNCVILIRTKKALEANFCLIKINSQFHGILKCLYFHKQIKTDLKNGNLFYAVNRSRSIVRLGLHERRFFRIYHESGTFWYRIRFAVYTQADESAKKRSGLVASPEILNPEFKVGSSYRPNTFESGKFCSVNDCFNKSGYFPPAFLYFFGNIFTLVKIFSRLKRLTSCGSLHLVVRYQLTKALLVFSAFNNHW